MLYCLGHLAPMYIVLSARVLNPALCMLSRAVDDASVAKLIRAGASHASSLYAIGGSGSPT